MPTKTVPETLAPFRVRYAKASKAGACSGCGKQSSSHQSPVNHYPRQTDAVVYLMEGVGGKYRLCRACVKTFRQATRERGVH